MDYKENIVNAGRIADSKGNLSQYPTFTQGGNVVNPDSIKYNFDNQKALIWNSKSEENGMNILSTLTKKQNDSVYYLKDAKVTTDGELKDSDYYFRVRKGKLIPGGKIVTGFTNMYIADVPTPLMLPFAYFPTSQNLESGFIFPSIGERTSRTILSVSISTSTSSFSIWSPEFLNHFETVASVTDSPNVGTVIFSDI